MSPSTVAESFTKTAFDIIIIGAGTAALPIAAKLSENPQILVGILEAGGKNDDDPLINTPQFLGSTTGNPKYDWNFASVAQEHALGRVIGFPRGKGVGGSTLINYLAWDRASKPEYDAWKSLGEKEDAWDWDSLIPYFKAAEAAAPLSTNPNEYPSMAIPSAIIIHPGIEDAVGSDGAVKTSHNRIYSDIIPPYVKAWNNIGAPINTNPWGGDASGLYNVRLAVDLKTGQRNSADSAYLTPEVLARQNLKILTGAQATKVLFKREPANVRATGVEFVIGGKTYVASASKEVVLSAGVIQTPQLLELSGIGNRKILEGLGIETLVDLAGVGENVQDHLFVPMQFLLKPGTKTFDELRNNPDFLTEQQAVYDSSGTGWLAAVDSTVCYNPLSKIVTPVVFSSMLERLEAAIAKEKGEGILTPLQEAQYAVQLDLLRAGEVPGLETLLMSKGYIAPEQGKSYFILMTGVQHPFSRGSIHIDSTDPLKAPLINPNFLSNKFDLESLLAGYRLMEKVVAAEPLKDLIEVQQLPPAILSEDEHALGFIRAAATTGSHLMGSCALARRDLGGVVGNTLKVYGTSNLRVADASIIPLSVSCHIQATVFAIGERAGDLIQRDL